MLHAKWIEKDSRKNVLYFNPAFFKDLKWIKEYINLNVQFVGKLRINMYVDLCDLMEKNQEFLYCIL